jgi:hypothetical protein
LAIGDEVVPLGFDGDHSVDEGHVAQTLGGWQDDVMEPHLITRQVPQFDVVGNPFLSHGPP